MLCLVTQSCLTLCNPMDCSPPGSLVHGNSPGKRTGVGCHALLQGIFPTQGSNSGLPHCGHTLYHLSHQGRGTLQTNITGILGDCLQCLGHIVFAPVHGMCAFPIYTAQAPGCSAGELSKAGPGLRALPRSKLLRFQFSGTPQRHRLGLFCILCPSQV